ncbi:MAG: hypothetical protein Q9159_005746 [Coniocarpon cinnabarinum]
MHGVSDGHQARPDPIVKAEYSARQLIDIEKKMASSAPPLKFDPKSIFVNEKAHEHQVDRPRAPLDSQRYDRVPPAWVSNVKRDPRLQRLFRLHLEWLIILRQDPTLGYTHDALYNRTAFCREHVLQPCMKPSCSQAHCVEFWFFVTTACILKWGFANHRSQRSLHDAVNDFNLPAISSRLCIIWAIRDETMSPWCLANCSVSCATSPQHMAALRSRRHSGNVGAQRTLHSFWALEECTYRLYLRIPSGKRPRLMRETLRALGFAEGSLDAPSR